MSQITFNDIQIGKKFKTYGNVTYQKISQTEAKPILDVKGDAISNGRVSSVFYNSKIPVIPVD